MAQIAYLGKNGYFTPDVPSYPDRLVPIGIYGHVSQTVGEMLVDLTRTNQYSLNSITSGLELKMMQNPGIDQSQPILASDIIIDTSARTLTIATVKGGTTITPSNPIRFFTDGGGVVVKHEKTSAVTFPAFTDLSGIWYFYFNSNGDPITSQNVWSDFTTKAALYRLYWNSTLSGSEKVVTEVYEAHLNDISSTDHAWKHANGSIYVRGLDIVSNLLDVGAPNADGRNTVIGILDGACSDDGLEWTVTNSANPINYFEQDLGSSSSITLDSSTGGKFFVKSNDNSGLLHFLPATRFPFAWDVSTNRPEYLVVNGDRNLVPDQSWFVYYVYNISDRRPGHAIKVASAETYFSTIDDATAHTWETLKGLYNSLRDNEIRPLYKIIFYTDLTYDAGSKYSVIRSIHDIRKQSTTSSVASAGTIIASNVVYAPNSVLTASNLQSALDELTTEKFQWEGLSGGQIAIGGTDPSDYLVLQGTSGNGILNSPAILFNVGNNGDNTSMLINNNGNIEIPNAQLLLSSGSPLMPNLSFAGETSTGIYSDGVNTISLSMSGIKTSSFNQNGLITIGYGVLNKTSPVLDGIGLPNTGIIKWTDGNIDVYDLGLSRGSSGNLFVGNGNLGDYSSSLIAAKIGIGIINPIKPLEVSGGVSLTNNNAFFIKDSSNSSYIEAIRLNTTNQFKIGNGSIITESLGGNSTMFVGGNNGNVGIGTTNPLAKLNVVGSFKIGDSSSLSIDSLMSRTSNGILANIHTYIPSNNSPIYQMIYGGVWTGERIGTTHNTNSQYQVVNPSNNYVRFGYINTVGSFTSANMIDVFVINSGKVGVGITNPTAQLHLKAGTTSGSSAPLKFSNGSLMSVTEDGTIEYSSKSFYIRGNDGLNVDGSLGVGTSTPSEKFQVSSGFASFAHNSANTYPTYNNFVSGAIGNNFSSGGGEVDFWNTSINGTSKGFVFRQQTSSSTNTVLMVVKGDGNVGIGTSSPRSNLDIGAFILGIDPDDSNYSDIWAANVTPSGSNYNWQVLKDGTEVIYNVPTGGLMEFTTDNDWANSAILIKNNKVGIGISAAITPTAYLHIRPGDASVGHAPLKLTSGQLLSAPEAGAIEFYGNEYYGTDTNSVRRSFVQDGLGSDEGQTIIGGTGVNDQLQLQGTSASGNLTSIAIKMNVGNNGATNAVSILNNAKVGIGTLSPQQTLDVSGNLQINGNVLINGTGDHIISGNSTSLNLNYNWWNGTENVPWVSLKDGGNVGIGTTSPTTLFQVVRPSTGVGTITVTSNTNVAGTGTQFLNTFKIGDSLTVINTLEACIVTSILSNTSMTVTSTTNTTSSRYTVTPVTSLNALSNGKVGIGIDVPSANLHIKSGTATAGTAPVKLTAGPLLAVPEAGTIEFDGTYFYLTI